MAGPASVEHASVPGRTVGALGDRNCRPLPCVLDKEPVPHRHQVDLLWMTPYVRRHERAARDDVHTDTSRVVERAFHQGGADPTPGQALRDFGVGEGPDASGRDDVDERHVFFVATDSSDEAPFVRPILDPYLWHSRQLVELICRRSRLAITDITCRPKLGDFLTRCLNHSLSMGSIMLSTAATASALRG